MLGSVVERLCHAASICGTGLCFVLGACQPQASPDYEGQSLLTVRGSVDITEDRTSGKLSPALAFIDRTGETIQILDVEVQGEFPSDFRLDVYSPPSDDVLIRFENYGDDEPRFGMSYITAVTEDHPESFEIPEVILTAVYPTKCDANGMCTHMMKRCTDESETRCYTETTFCPSIDAPAEECRVEGEGDPSLVASTWRFFAGFSRNFVIAYLKEPARAGTFTAAYLGSAKGMRRGYHLLYVRQEASEELQQQYNECTERSVNRVIERYNEEHGTDYTVADLEVEVCGFGCLLDSPDCEEPQPKPAICDEPSEQQDDFIETVHRRSPEVQVELRCFVSQFEPIDDPKKAEIAIEITPDASPTFGPHQGEIF